VGESQLDEVVKVQLFVLEGHLHCAGHFHYERNVSNYLESMVQVHFKVERTGNKVLIGFKLDVHSIAAFVLALGNCLDEVWQVRSSSPKIMNNKVFESELESHEFRTIFH